MRRWAGLAVLAVLGAVTAGCVGDASHHPTLSAKEALAQARSDGFVRPVRYNQLLTYLCAEHQFVVGTSTSGRYAGYTRPTYQLEFDDSRVHVGPGNVARIAMVITVFPEPRRPAVRPGWDLPRHASVTSQRERTPLAHDVDPTTIVIDKHEAGRRGDSFRDDTGQYDTFFAQGRVFAQGLAANVPHSKIVREDLERLAAEIAG